MRKLGHWLILSISDYLPLTFQTIWEIMTKYFEHSHVFRKETKEIFLTYDQAVMILKRDLKYPEERALHFVRKFDKNKDGKISVEEFKHFKEKVEET